MGWLKDFVTNPAGTVANTVSNVVSNPAGAIGDFWNTGGRDAAALAAAYYGGNYLFGGGGAGAGAADLAASYGAGGGGVGAGTAAGIGGGMGAADLAAAYGAGGGGVGAGTAAGIGGSMAGAGGVNALTGAGMGTSWMMPAAILGSSLYGANAAQQAGSAQAAAASRAADLQYQQFRDTAALQEPFRQVGIRALPQLEAQRNMMPGAFTGKVDLTQDPGYAFRFSEGQKALDRSAAVRSGAMSGSALKNAVRFGQDYGSQEYQNAYNRALTGYNADVAREATGYNRLAALAGYGPTATGQIGAAGQNMASNVGNLMTSGAAANAAGSVGSANALTGGLGSYLNYAGQQDMLAAYNDRTRRSTYT
jgi:hypothetical protein